MKCRYWHDLRIFAPVNFVHNPWIHFLEHLFKNLRVNPEKVTVSVLY